MPAIPTHGAMTDAPPWITRTCAGARTASRSAATTARRSARPSSSSRDREGIGFVAATQGIEGEDVQDLMPLAVEARFGRVNRLPQTIEWLTDNGSGYIAGETKRLARDIGLEPRTTPVQSPQPNGMAEAFVRTIKRDHVRVFSLPDARTLIDTLPIWFERYNTLHPNKALGYLSPREFIASRQSL